MFNELLWLIFGHFLGDYGLQTDWVAVKKKSNNYILIAHAVIYSGLICMILHYFGILEIWKVIFIFSGHAIMDYIKIHSKKEIWKVDQFVHFLQLLIILL